MAIALVAEHDRSIDELMISPWPRPVLSLATGLVGDSLAVDAPSVVEQAGHPRSRPGQPGLGGQSGRCLRPMSDVRPASVQTPQWATRHATIPARTSAPVRRRRIILGGVFAVLAIALALPLSALGGRPVSSTSFGVRTIGTTPATYVVRSGDSLHSIAIRFAVPGQADRLQSWLAKEIGSGTVVPGEHVQMP